MYAPLHHEHVAHHDTVNEKGTAAETERGTAAENAKETEGGMIRARMTEKETMIDGNATRALTEDEIVRGTEAESGVGEALNTLTTSALRRLHLLKLRGGTRKICTPTDKGGIDHRMLVGRMVAGGASIWRVVEHKEML